MVIGVLRNSRLAVVAWLVFAVWPTVSLASNQGPAGANTGGTSFMDGFGPPVAGFTYQAYLSYSAGRAINDSDGNEERAFNPATNREELVFKDPQIDAFTLMNQLSYFFPQTWFGDMARPGLNFMLPLVIFNTSFGKPGVALKDNGIGFGDLTLGPILQFKPIMAGRRPVFSHRIEILMVAPIGKYNPAKDINQGSNYLSFYPNWALTVMPLPAWEVTARIQYLFNARNDSPTGFPRDPNTGAPLDVKSAQAGQVFLMNFATSYEIFRSFRVGANGYFYTQLNADTFKLADGTEKDGVALGEGKAQVLGIGPGMVWEAATTDQLFANVYFQPIAKAKAQSTVFQIRWLHGF